MVELPLGEIEVGGRAFPTPVVGPEPGGPFAGGLASQELSAKWSTYRGCRGTAKVELG